MNRRSFFSFLSAAPVGLPVALAGISSTDGLIGDELHQMRVARPYKLGCEGTSGPRCAGAIGVPTGEVVHLKTHGGLISPGQIRELFDAINAGIKDGHRLHDARGES